MIRKATQGWLLGEYVGGQVPGSTQVTNRRKGLFEQWVKVENMHCTKAVNPGNTKKILTNTNFWVQEGF